MHGEGGLIPESCIFVGFGLLQLAADINLAIGGNQAEIRKKSQTKGAGVCSGYLKNFWHRGFEMTKERLKRKSCC